MRDAETENAVPSIGLVLLAALWLVPVLFLTPWLFFGVWPKLPEPTQPALAIWWTASGLTLAAIAGALLRRRSRIARAIASWIFTHHAAFASSSSR